MEDFDYLFLFYIVGAVICLVTAIRKYENPSALVFTGLLLTVFGAFIGVDMMNAGRFMGRPLIEGLGESFLVFISVIGGALVSNAISEIRERRFGSSKQERGVH